MKHLYRKKKKSQIKNNKQTVIHVNPAKVLKPDLLRRASPVWQIWVPWSSPRLGRDLQGWGQGMRPMKSGLPITSFMQTLRNCSSSKFRTLFICIPLMATCEPPSWCPSVRSLSVFSLLEGSRSHGARTCFPAHLFGAPWLPKWDTAPENHCRQSFKKRLHDNTEDALLKGSKLCRGTWCLSHFIWDTFLLLYPLLPGWMFLSQGLMNLILKFSYANKCK